MRRLLPDTGPTTVEEHYGRLGLTELGHDDRPWVIVNFAATVDGRATIDGRSGKIGSATDSAILHRLRTQVDAVMIGAGTMRAERYGRMVPDPELRAWREQIGLAPDPLAVIVSGRLELPWDAPLFSDGNGKVVIFTASDAQPPATETAVEVVRHEGGVDLPGALAHLHGEHEIRALLCEGGPHLHAQLWAAGLADELFLTTAPKLAGGTAPRIVEGALPDVTGLELVSLADEDGELYARYRRA